MIDKMIELNSPRGKELGFVSERFTGWLWEKDHEIWISFIESRFPGKGHFKELVQSCLKEGKTVIVPTPLGRMQHIVRAAGFQRRKTRLKDGPMAGEILETWRLSPSK